MADLLAFALFVSVAACFGAAFLLIACEILSFHWLAALSRIRFSMATLLVVTAAIGFAFGPFPFPLILAFCLMCAFVNFVWDRSSSALESYRRRHDSGFSAIQVEGSSTGASVARAKKRKWWLRRILNRFRSIYYSQATPPSGFYDRGH